MKLPVHPLSTVGLLPRLIAVLALLVLCWPAHAATEDAKREHAERWIPSLAFTSGMTFQEWEGDLSSRVCRDCLFSDPGGSVEALQPAVSGDDRDQTPFAGLELQLMSPELRVPGSPRIFVGVEILPTFGTDRKIATTGDIGEVGTRASNPESQSFSEDTAQGQGAELTLTREDMSYGAHIGVAFPLEVYDRPVLIKPRFGWLRFGVDLEGAVSDADCLPQGTTTECNPNDLGQGFGNGFLRATRLDASSTESFDAIGGGLDIETLTPRIGPIHTAIFAGFHFFHVLGDRQVETRVAPQTISDLLGTDQVDARFDYEVDEWIYRFAVGLRLQWVGGEF